MKVGGDEVKKDVREKTIWEGGGGGVEGGGGGGVGFFFQAEDGIRHWSVTGVQTCALPIYLVFNALAISFLDSSMEEEPATESVRQGDRVLIGLSWRRP